MPFSPRSAFALALLVCVPLRVSAQCPEEPALFNFTGPGNVVCPCFIAGEEAGAVLTPPAGTVYPIELLRVGITWGSQFGGAPTSLEQAIHFYPSGLPNPGTRLFSLLGPQLTDGFINEFDLEATASTVVVNGAPFTVTLEFLNDNAGNFFAPSVVHDGDGCQAGKNVVNAIPGGWLDACPLGVTGDWVFYVIYRPLNCATDAPEELMVASAPTALSAPRPNPVRDGMSLEFFVENERPVNIAVFDLQGRRIADLAGRTYTAGTHAVAWDTRGADGSLVPAGVYFVTLESGDRRHTRKVVVAR